MESRTYLFILLSFLAINIQPSEQQQCLTTLDLIFLVDGSNSMGLRNYEEQKQSINSLATSLNVSEAEVHIGLVLFSKIVNAVINLTGNKTAFIEANNNLDYPDEETRLDLAIDSAIEMFNKTGRNSTVPRVMMVITDGVSTDPNKTLISANLAKSRGIKIFAIGVTNATDIHELTNISSPGTQVFITEDFTTLASVLNNATNRVCLDLQTTTESASTSTQPPLTTSQPPATTSQPPATTSQPPDNTTNQPSANTTATSGPPVTECQGAMLDIVFLLDSSSKVGVNNWPEITSFIRDFLFFANVDNGTIRVGAVTFSDEAHVQFYLNTYSSKSAINNAIDNLQYRPGGANMAAALRSLRTTMLTTNAGHRSDVQNVVILLSANDSVTNMADVVAEAESTVVASVQIYGIGVGYTNSKLLDAVVSRPHTENKFLVDSFADLKYLIPQIYNNLNKLCPRSPPVEACFMGQTDLWLVVDVSQTSETLSRAQAAGDFQKLKNGLNKLIQVIQDSNVANPGVSLGLVAYSNMSSVASDVTQVKSVNETASAVQQLPGGVSQGAPELASALRNIITVPVNSSYRSYVAIVAPQSSFTSNRTSLREELARLKTLGYTIVIFAVMENGSFDQQTLQADASGSRYFYAIPEFSNLETEFGNFARERLCNGRKNNNSGLCAESGHRENGVGVVAHPRDCDKYIQCYYDELNDLDLGIVRNCPRGLHWSAENRTCTNPSQANCTNDRCKEECSEYKMEGACGAYWECEDGVSSPRCCQQNYTFVPDLGCQPDDTCTDQCGTEKWCGKCQKKPNWERPSGYDVMILGGNMWLPRPCFYQDFDIVDCDCTAPRDHVCPADREFVFTDAQTTDAINKGDKPGIRASDVTYNPEAVILGHKSAVHVSVAKAARENQPFTLEFRFRELETYSPYGETLLSSGVNCGTANSLLVSANDEFIIAEVKAGQHTSEVKVPLKGLNKEDFKDLVLSYDDGVLALSIKDEQTQYIAKTQAPDNLCFSCGLDIGHGLNKLSFDGEIEKIAVYSCAWKLLY